VRGSSTPTRGDGEASALWCWWRRVLGGCQSSASSSGNGQAAHPTSSAYDAAFWRRASVRCHELIAWFPRHAKEFERFNPIDPRPPGLHIFYTEMRQAPLFKPHAMRRLADELGRPDTGTAAWDGITGELARWDASVATWLRDARRRDLAAFSRDYPTFQAMGSNVAADLYALGLPSSNQCGRLFGN
jgi:hypothetical protein